MPWRRMAAMLSAPWAIRAHSRSTICSYWMRSHDAAAPAIMARTASWKCCPEVHAPKLYQLTFDFVCVCVRVNLTNAHYFGVFAVIPQSCRFRGHKFECGLSISCVLGGGKPLDLCSGGMIWSCCVDKDIDAEESPHAAPVNNTSE